MPTTAQVQYSFALHYQMDGAMCTRAICAFHPTCSSAHHWPPCFTTPTCCTLTPPTATPSTHSLHKYASTLEMGGFCWCCGGGAWWCAREGCEKPLRTCTTWAGCEKPLMVCTIVYMCVYKAQHHCTSRLHRPPHPIQEESVDYVVSTIKNALEQHEEGGPKRLFLIQTYVIGKERILIAIHQMLGLKIYASQRKLGIFKCLDWPGVWGQGVVFWSGGVGWCRRDGLYTYMCVFGHNHLLYTPPHHNDARYHASYTPQCTPSYTPQRMWMWTACLPLTQHPPVCMSHRGSTWVSHGPTFDPILSIWRLHSMNMVPMR